MSALKILHALSLAGALTAGIALSAAAQDQSGPMTPPQAPPAAAGGASATTQTQAGQTPATQNGATAGAAPSPAAPTRSAETSNTPSANDPKLARRPPPISADAAAAAAAASSAAPKIEVPSGTHLSLVLHNAVSTHSARPGDPVYFETIFPVMVNGKVAIPAGSYVSGEVTDSKRAGRVKGRAELMIKLTTLILPNSYMVNLNASPSNAGTGGGETVDNEGTIKGDSDKASDAATVIKGTAIGAGIGGVAAQSGKGAGIGAGIGAAAGLMTVLLTRGPDAELPRGSTVEAVLDRAIYLDADKDQFATPGQASALPGPPNREPQRQKIPF